jgi:hypothetical protein
MLQIPQEAKDKLKKECSKFSLGNVTPQVAATLQGIFQHIGAYGYSLALSQSSQDLTKSDAIEFAIWIGKFCSAGEFADTWNYLGKQWHTDKLYILFKGLPQENSVQEKTASVKEVYVPVSEKIIPKEPGPYFALFGGIYNGSVVYSNTYGWVNQSLPGPFEWLEKITTKTDVSPIGVSNMPKNDVVKKLWGKATFLSEERYPNDLKSATAYREGMFYGASLIGGEDLEASGRSPDLDSVVTPHSSVGNSIEQEDAFILKHLERIRAKMREAQIDQLITEHLNWHSTDLRMASAKSFVESGRVSGNLYSAIRKIALGFAQYTLRAPMLNDNHPLNTEPSNSTDKK